MPRELLKPSIENRILMLSESIEDNLSDIYLEFMDLLNQFQEGDSDNHIIRNKLENVFILKTHAVCDLAYRSGIEDGLKLKSF